MGDGTEIPWDLSPGTRVPGLGLGLGLIFVGLPGLGLIFVGQSRQGAGTGTENPGTWDSKIPWDWLSPTGLQLIPRTNVKWQILNYPYPQNLKPYNLVHYEILNFCKIDSANQINRK